MSQEKAGRCPSCGRERGSGRFCPFCGAPADEPASEGTVMVGAAPGEEPSSGETVLVGEPPSDREPASDGTVMVESAQTGEQPPSEGTVMLGGPPPRGTASVTPDTRAGPSIEERVAGAVREKPDPEPPGDTGMKFGRYRVLREVGRGAMGVVYLARDDRIGRNVAVKVLHLDPRLSEEEKREISERFNREAHAAGMLSHPNIVTVYDVGEEEGIPYIAMEYLEGATLTEITAEGPLSISQATDIVSQVLSALSYAHGHEVVHRDIKPDNVFLLPDGRVKVADFGIARVSSSSTMTSVGQVMGTPGYMSPEQVKGEAVGPASDIFSVGVLLYELLTGIPPFASSSTTSIMYKIVHEEPTPPSTMNPAVPPNLEAVIARACAKNPGARYARASEMKDDIKKGRAPAVAPAASGTLMRSPDATILRGPEAAPAYGAPPAPAAAPARKRTGLLVGLGALVVAIIAGTVVAVVLLAGGGVSVKIKSPAAGQKVEGGEVSVTLEVEKPEKIARVEFYVDWRLEETVEREPFEATVPAGGRGSHELTVTARGKDGAMLAQATGSFESAGGAQQQADYPQALSGKIAEASALDQQIRTYANRINSETAPGSVSPALLAELKSLKNSTDSLKTSVHTLSAPADMQDLHSQFIRIVEYLRIRAEALLSGTQDRAAGGSGVAAYDRGGGAKKSFDAEWPGFIASCRFRGISV